MSICAFSPSNLDNDPPSGAHVSRTAPQFVTRKYRQNVSPQQVDTTDTLIAAPGPMADTAIVPGEPATEITLSRVRSRVLLLDLIQKYSKETDTDNPDHNRITEATSQAAVAFFSALPPSTKLPKITPEGEGGLTVIWENGSAPVILVVDDWKLHLVKAATTPHAQYFDDLLFDGERVPNEVIEALPKY